MKIYQVIGYLLLAFSVSAVAENPINEIQRCTSIENDIARLICFDELGKTFATADKPEQSFESSGKWTVKIDVNPVDDSKRASMVLAADTGNSRFGDVVSLIVRCSSRELNVYINWNDYLGDSAEVLTRVGSAKATTTRWPLSTDSQATFYPNNPKTFINQLLRVDRLVAQVTPYNESPVTAIFDLTGMDMALEPVRDACGWSKRAPKKRAPKEDFPFPIIGEIMHEGLSGASFVQVTAGWVEVSKVKEKSRAWKNGLRVGDSVFAINDVAVSTLEELNTAVSNGRPFDLKIVRAKKTKVLQIR